MGPSVSVLAYPAFSSVTSNPYTYLLYRSLEKWGFKINEYFITTIFPRRADIFHIHWPETVLADAHWKQRIRHLGFFLVSLNILKFRRSKIVWTVHNVRPHEERTTLIGGFLWRRFLRNVDVTIHLSGAARDIAFEQLPNLAEKPSFVVPHGHYRDAYSFELSRSKARSVLSIDSKSTVILFFGKIRRYKNVDTLVRAFRQLSVDDVLLVIAGQPHSRDKTIEGELQDLAEGDDRIRLALKFMSDDSLVQYITAADIVVLPFKRILNSGSVLLALSGSRPVLAPRQASLQELQHSVGEDWLFLYDNELDAETLEEALTWAKEQSISEGVAPLDKLSWDEIAKQTRDVYLSALSKNETR